MHNFQGIWIRAAVIRKGDDPDPTMVWRIFPQREAPAIHVRSCHVVGQAMAGQSLLLGQDPEAAPPLGLRAWVDFFGDLTISHGVATITLRSDAP